MHDQEHTYDSLSSLPILGASTDGLPASLPPFPGEAPAPDPCLSHPLWRKIAPYVSIGDDYGPWRFNCARALRPTSHKSGCHGSAWRVHHATSQGVDKTDRSSAPFGPRRLGCGTTAPVWRHTAGGMGSRYHGA